MSDETAALPPETRPGGESQEARAIRAVLPAVPGHDAGVWVRELPRSLKPQNGVIELWIPPREAAAGTAH